MKFILNLFILSLSFTWLFHSTPVEARDAVSGKEVTGTFENPQGSTFEILALGKNKLKVKFEGIYPYEVNGMATANLGEANGIAVIEADTARFKPEGFEKACLITLVFTQPGEMKATQQGDAPDCGFGRGVSAAGTYRKTGSAKPSFK